MRSKIVAILFLYLCTQSSYCFYYTEPKPKYDTANLKTMNWRDVTVLALGGLMGYKAVQNGSSRMWTVGGVGIPIMAVSTAWICLFYELRKDNNQMNKFRNAHKKSNAKKQKIAQEAAMKECENKPYYKKLYFTTMDSILMLLGFASSFIITKVALSIAHSIK